MMVYGINIPKDSKDEYIPTARMVYGIAAPKNDEQSEKNGFLDKVKSFFRINKNN